MIQPQYLYTKWWANEEAQEEKDPLKRWMIKEKVVPIQEEKPSVIQKQKAPSKLKEIIGLNAPKREAVKGLEKVAGLGEAGLTLGSGALGYPIGLGAGLGKIVYDIWKSGGRKASFEDAEKFMNKVMEYTIYQPKTEFGQYTARVGASPFEGIVNGIDEAAKVVTKDPEKQAALRLGGQAVLMAFLPKLKGFAQRVSKGKELLWRTPQTTEPTSIISEMSAALKEAKPLRKKQEALYTEERGKRFAASEAVGKEIGGEAGFYAEKAKLAGELPKIQKGIQFESIRGKFTQENINAVFNQINKSPMLTYLETLPAREGLAKIFGDVGGKVPTTKEIILLSRVFGKEFTQTILSKRGAWEKIKGGLYETANIPRAVMASYDLSAPFRQGIFLISEPKEFFNSFAKMFEYFGSEEAFRGLTEEIASRPTYDLMRKSGLSLTEMDSILGLREERFMSHFAEKIPGIRQSGRAYTGFLNKLRADVFDKLIQKAEKDGLNPQKNIYLSRQIANFVNAASGRGSLGALEHSAVAFNTALFSPRLTASRLTLLNPAYYIKADPFVRRQALKSLFTLVGAGSTVLSLAQLGGLEVGTSPFSSDFGKIKIGNTRIDPWGGFQQYARTAFQFAFGKARSTTTGKTSKIDRLSVLTRWFEYKEAPVVSFAVGLLRGKTVFGAPFSLTKEVGNRFVPMVIQDTIDIAKEDPELLPLSTLGIFGFGLQTYKQKKKGIPW